MIDHVCPICSRTHAVREARDSVAYGRQLTCSPECESVRRKRMRERPAAAAPAGSTSADVASVLHAWVTMAAAADLVRTAATAHRIAVRRR
jgi:hypothetical protein